MTDLPAMPKCIGGKRGRHSLSYILPEDGLGDLTAVCDLCGAMRRVPVSGSILSPLDDQDAEAIWAAVQQPGPRTQL